MSLDRATVRSVVLIGWSAFLLWLWVTDETLRYLGPRTDWLVPFGAVMLGAVGAANAWVANRRPSAARQTSAGELLALAAMVLPIATGFLLAHSQLGALAASRKLTARGIDPAALAELAARDATQLSFLQLNVAQKDSDFAARYDIRPGREVRLVGFVSKAATEARGPFQLSRFYITCCVADSIPVGVKVRPADPRGAAPRRDQWLTVTGELVRDGRALALRATRIRPVDAPRHPYLSFTS